jgi:hypothetical protein
MNTRPEVIQLLLDTDPAATFTHADGDGFTVDQVDLAFSATPEELVEAAETRLVTRAQAVQAIRTHLLGYLRDAGMTAGHAARLADGMSLRLEKIPHPALLKITPLSSGPETITTQAPGRDRITHLAREAGLPYNTVYDLMRRRAASGTPETVSPTPAAR